MIPIHQLEPGDKVTIINNKKHIPGPQNMRKYAGEEVTIAKTNNNGFLIKEDEGRFHWPLHVITRKENNKKRKKAPERRFEFSDDKEGYQVRLKQ